MRAVRGRNTAPELFMRRLLTRLGYRYRLHRADLPGKPDLAFIGRRKALFVHGCFWHGHGCARGSRAPKTNAAFWAAKIARNRARDASVEAAFAAIGWRTLAVWGCELRSPDLAERLAAFLGPT